MSQVKKSEAKAHCRLGKPQLYDMETGQRRRDHGQGGLSRPPGQGV